MEPWGSDEKSHNDTKKLLFLAKERRVAHLSAWWQSWWMIGCRKRTDSFGRLPLLIWCHTVMQWNSAISCWNWNWGNAVHCWINGSNTSLFVPCMQVQSFMAGGPTKGQERSKDCQRHSRNCTQGNSYCANEGAQVCTTINWDRRCVYTTQILNY